MIAGQPLKINRLVPLCQSPVEYHYPFMARFATRCQDGRMPGKQYDFSMGEITTRAKLAIRGLGYSWGVAEDVGWAIGWLEQRDFPGLTLLASLCQHIDERFAQVTETTSIETGLRPQALSATWTASEGQLCPILSGLALSDGGIPESHQGGLTLQNVMYPVLILPFVAVLAQTSNVLVECRFGDLQAITDGEHLWIAPSPLTDRNSLSISAHDVFIAISPESQRPSFEPWPNHRSRASVTSSIWSILDQFAHRTYAPATEQSRILGAGAGVNDND